MGVLVGLSAFGCWVLVWVCFRGFPVFSGFSSCGIGMMAGGFEFWVLVYWFELRAGVSFRVGWVGFDLG